MDGEITLDRGEGGNMNLDESEQAMMNEIQLEFPKPQTMSRKQSPPRAPGRAPVAGPSPVRYSAPPKQMFRQDDMNEFANPTKQNAPPPPEHEDPIDYGEDDDEDEGGYGGPAYMEEPEEEPSPGYKTIDEEKADLVNKLGRLEKKGFTVNKRLTAYSPVDELRTEVKRITYGVEVDKSVKFSRRMLIACVTGLEFLNKRYDPFDIQLEGWSENIMEGVDDYDEVFEELYVKYRTKMHMAPEVKLIMMLGGSAMMFHLTNSMFKSVMPNMTDVAKQNPDLMQNMMSAVQSTMAGGATSGSSGSSGSPSSSGRHEMKGPGMDISSLMGNIMMPPIPPMNTSAAAPQEMEDDDDVSDIASEGGGGGGDSGDENDIKQVAVTPAKAKKGGRKKKVEINL
jgi:hypothetical protein